MKKIAIIPARYAATRFPAKLMQMLGSKTVILHTYQNTVATHLFDEVMVVTDSEIIKLVLRGLLATLVLFLYYNIFGKLISSITF